MNIVLMRIGFFLSILVGSASCLAHQAAPYANPIAWELSRPFLKPIPNGSSDTITYQLTNQLPWALNHPLVIKKTGLPNNEFSYVDHCSGQRLNSLETCLINITVSPLVQGDKSFQLRIGGYSKNEVDLFPLATDSFLGVQSAVVGTVEREVPAQMTSGTAYDYRFKFINTSNSMVSNPLVTITPTQGTLSSQTNTCTTSIPVGGSCVVSGQFTPSGPNANVVAVLNYDGGSSSVATNVGGRVIGYLEAWNLPPSAQSISAAGYTHVLIAFGVFSTTHPGEIVPVLSGIPDPVGYIQSLQKLGIKVLLSLGGANSNVPNTTVNFDQVLAAAPDPATFETTFKASLDTLVTTYGFDGFDFDIEHGLIPSGTFTQPTGDIAVLSSIINSYHTSKPELLLSLVPQIANISATSAFNETFGNYSSLIMQTYPSLSWVGIQLYNAGCAFGIDCNCWDPNTLTTTPDPAVAFVTDLLAPWPSTCPAGQASGFQAYTGPLVPSQVVLGYPVKNGQGNSDGQPPAVLLEVKRALQCLRTGVQSSSSCDTYLPPTTYPTIGGVFSWDINYDSSNAYQFATGIYPCAVTGTCT